MEVTLRDLETFKKIKEIWNKKEEATLITHTDVDGIGCRYMARDKEFKNIYHVDYADSEKVIIKLLPTMKGTIVFLTDFSPSQLVIDLFKDNDITWYLIDHHRSTQELKDKYPDNVWLEQDYCSTEQVYMLGDIPEEDDEDRLIADLIGIGDLFRDDDELFWTARELTMVLKKITDMLYPFYNKQDLFDNVYWCMFQVLTIIKVDVAYMGLSPRTIEDLGSNCIKATLHEVSDSKEDMTDMSTTQLLLEVEANAALSNKGVRKDDVLFIDDVFRNNFSSLCKDMFDKDTSLQYIVKIGKNGSLSARGSKHFEEADVSLFNNDTVSIKGHKLAGGGKIEGIKVPIGNLEALTEASKLF